MLIAVLVIGAIVAVFLDTLPGKIAAGSTVTALGLLLLSWITGWGFLVTLAKVCAAIIVITVVGAVLMAIKN